MAFGEMVERKKIYIINIKKLPQKYLLKSFKINKKKPEKREKYVLMAKGRIRNF